MRKTEIFLRAILVPLDFLGTIFAFWAAYKLRVYPDFLPFATSPVGTIPPWEEYLPFVLGVAVFLNIIFFIQQLYKLKNYKRFIKEIPDITYAIFIWAMFIMAWFFVRREFFFSRLMLGYSMVFTALMVLWVRALAHLIKRILWKYDLAKTRVIIIGDGAIMQQVRAELAGSKSHRIVGSMPGVNWDLLEELIKKEKPHELILTKTELTRLEKAELLEFCRENKIAFRVLSSIFELHSRNIEISSIAGLPVMEFKPSALSEWGKILKRITDLVVSIVLLIILSPLFLIVGIIIKSDSKGPVFVKLTRINQGEKFSMLKFRSMVDGAEKLKADLMQQNERSGPLFKIKDDPRVTKVGKFLRKSRIDEFPQLINVIKGQMSLVGPRPHEPQEVEQYEKRHRKLLAIKPGMTGLAQVKGASDLDFEDEFKIDTYYIENWSLWMDFEIMLRTIWVVLTGKGAA
ncbi:MAG: sugar transferase [Candidatus Gracilibacteria bacterium]|nr:sugar transferase [Candidatus Gracilibacteria bacterium]